MTLMSLIRENKAVGKVRTLNVRLQESAAPWKHDSHSMKDGKPNPTTSAHTILFLNVIWVLNIVLLRPLARLHLLSALLWLPDADLRRAPWSRLVWWPHSAGSGERTLITTSEPWRGFGQNDATVFRRFPSSTVLISHKHFLKSNDLKIINTFSSPCWRSWQKALERRAAMKAEINLHLTQTAPCQEDYSHHEPHTQTPRSLFCTLVWWWFAVMAACRPKCAHKISLMSTPAKSDQFGCFSAVQLRMMESCRKSRRAVTPNKKDKNRI